MGLDAPCFQESDAESLRQSECSQRESKPQVPLENEATLSGVIGELGEKHHREILQAEATKF